MEDFCWQQDCFKHWVYMKPLFQIKFRFIESCEYSTDNFHIPHTQFPLLLISNIDKGMFVTLRNNNDTLCYLKCILYSNIFSSFYKMLQNYFDHRKKIMFFIYRLTISKKDGEQGDQRPFCLRYNFEVHSFPNLNSLAI